MWYNLESLMNLLNSLGNLVESLKNFLMSILILLIYNYYISILLIVLLIVFIIYKNNKVKKEYKKWIINMKKGDYFFAIVNFETCIKLNPNFDKNIFYLLWLCEQNLWNNIDSLKYYLKYIKGFMIFPIDNDKFKKTLILLKESIKIEDGLEKIIYSKNEKK